MPNEFIISDRTTLIQLEKQIIAYRQDVDIHKHEYQQLEKRISRYYLKFRKANIQRKAFRDLLSIDAVLRVDIGKLLKQAGVISEHASLDTEELENNVQDMKQLMQACFRDRRKLREKAALARSRERARAREAAKLKQEQAALATDGSNDITIDRERLHDELMSHPNVHKVESEVELYDENSGTPNQLRLNIHLSGILMKPSVSVKESKLWDSVPLPPIVLELLFESNQTSPTHMRLAGPSQRGCHSLSPHPHWLGPVNPCLGDFSTAIAQAGKQGNILSMVHIHILFLSQYNPRSNDEAGIYYLNWREDPEKHAGNIKPSIVRKNSESYLCTEMDVNPMAEYIEREGSLEDIDIKSYYREDVQWCFEHRDRIANCPCTSCESCNKVDRYCQCPTVETLEKEEAQFKMYEDKIVVDAPRPVEIEFTDVQPIPVREDNENEEPRETNVNDFF